MVISCEDWFLETIREETTIVGTVIPAHYKLIGLFKYTEAGIRMPSVAYLDYMYDPEIVQPKPGDEVISVFGNRILLE